MLKRKIPAHKDLVEFVYNVVRSSFFLAANGTLYVNWACIISKLLAHNYWTVGFGASWLAALISIFIERKPRRTPLAIYVSYIVSCTKIIYLSLADIIASSLPNL